MIWSDLTWSDLVICFNPMNTRSNMRTKKYVWCYRHAIMHTSRVDLQICLKNCFLLNRIIWSDQIRSDQVNSGHASNRSDQIRSIESLICCFQIRSDHTEIRSDQIRSSKNQVKSENSSDWSDLFRALVFFESPSSKKMVVDSYSTNLPLDEKRNFWSEHLLEFYKIRTSARLTQHNTALPLPQREPEKEKNMSTLKIYFVRKLPVFREF